MKKVVTRRLPVGKILSQTAQKNISATGIVFAWVGSTLLGLFGKQLLSLNNGMAWIYKNWILWAPPNHNFDLLDFNLLFWPFAGLYWLIRSGILALLKWKKRKNEIIANPLVLYKDELAATMNVLDNETDLKKVDSEIVDFLRIVADTIAANLRISNKDYRMYFVVPNPDVTETGPVVEVKISGFMLGRQFERADKNKLSEEEMDELIAIRDDDLDVLRRVIKKDKTEVIFPDSISNDAKMYLLGKKSRKSPFSYIYCSFKRCRFD